MTSVSSYSSPLQALQAQLSSSISAGTIKSADKDALTTALTDLDSRLNASRNDPSTGKPGDMKQKVDDLIAKEVSNGTLTSDQATELEGVFEQTFSQGGTGAAGGAGGPGGPDGPGGPGGAGGPPPDGDSSGDSSDSTTSSTSTTDASDLLQQFLKTLQAQLTASASSYTSSGTGSTSSSSSASSLLVDYTS